MLRWSPHWSVIDEFLSFEEMSTPPTTSPSNQCRLYAKDVGGVSTLCYRRDNGTEVCLTGGATIDGSGAANRLAYWTDADTLAAVAAIAQGHVLFADSNGLPTGETNLFWDAANNELGVGTAAPNALLHVFGTAFPVFLSERETASTNVKVGGTVVKSLSTGDMVDGFGAELLFNIGDGGASSNFIAKIGAVRQGADNSGAFFVDTYSAGVASEKFRIESGGQVGIGTTAPDVKLHLVDEAGDAIVKIESNNASASPSLAQHRSRGTNASKTDVADGDFFLNIVGRPFSGGTFFSTAEIDGAVDGTFTTGQRPPSRLEFYTNVANAGQVLRVIIKSHGSVVLNGSGSALATNATDGFTYIPTCAGTPTGTPTAFTGAAPMVIDSTNNKLYFYSGGAWRDAGP